MIKADRCIEAGSYSLVITQKAKEGQKDDGSVSKEWGHNFIETTFKNAVAHSCEQVKRINQGRKNFKLCDVEIINATLKFKGASDRDITKDIKEALR